MMYRINLATLLVFFIGTCFAQTAAISSKDEVCLNELIAFQATVSGSATSFAWDFGDASSSTQKNPSHTYSSVGPHTITLTVNFSGGGSKVATKSIVVHDLPKADFKVENSSFCFYSQDVCITDNSTMGSTTNGYDTRLILWGDGAQTVSSFPNSNKVTCYSSYPKPSSVPYTIIAEVKNDKGCEDKWRTDITILDDYKPHFQYKRSGATCDDQEVCFYNDSSQQRGDIQSFEWDFGDGTVVSSNWNSVCHKYTKSGAYRATLRITLKNGCVSTYSRVFSINIYEFVVNVTLYDSVKCFPETFRASHPLISGADYTWQIYDMDTVFLYNSGFGIVQPISVSCPGDYLLRLRIRVGNCTRYGDFFRLKSEGVDADFIPLNERQCPELDTVYTFNTTKKHPEAKPIYSWDFQDHLSTNCLGWRTNCNMDDEKHSRHMYRDTGCYMIKLNVTDPVSGCTSEYEDTISVIDPLYIKHKYYADKPCIGFKGDYAVAFTNNVCDGKFTICHDSLANPNLFHPLQGGVVYYTTADTNGWVTVGIASELGSEKVYHSPDTADYTIEPGNICRDTTWFHHWFQLHPEPKPDILVRTDTNCLPIEKRLVYYGTEGGKLEYFKYKWFDMDPYTTDTVINGEVDSVSFTYKEEGGIVIKAIVEDSFGCYSKIENKETLGFENYFWNVPLVCINKPVVFEDTVRYYGDTAAYWRRAGSIESMSWDFGDGHGFVKSGPLPIHSYPSIGRYIIKMATVDRKGCVDTAYNAIEVGSIVAAIEDNSEDYLCDQIIQFFDSSYFTFGNSSDFIKEYYWDFGDNTKESYLQNPFHYYTRNGGFTITLAIETDAGCVDTAKIPIYLKGPEPYFEILTDTVGCMPHTVEFKSTSTNVSSYNWYLGDPQNTTISSSSDTTFSFTYDKPGIYYIRLEGSDSFYNVNSNNTYTCSAAFPDTASSDTVRRVVVLPIPETRFDFEEPACVGSPVKFVNRSDTIYTDFNWTIGDHDTSNKEDLIYVFNEPGTFDILYKPTYVPEGPYQRECFDSFSNTIDVSNVEAHYSFVKQGMCSEFVFTDSSINAISYNWNFDHPKSGDRNTSNIPNPVHKYSKDSGTYNVCLIVENKEGCTDTACHELTAEYFKELKLYNVFTPNGDGV
ncbi:MAG: PKD domain-containing protein, partial [Bacteroidia bacterium]